jgi:hypothetical protein
MSKSIYKSMKIDISMKKVGLMIALILCITILPFVSSLQGTYKQYSSVVLTQSCFDAGAMCDACNITSITSPTSVVLLSNTIMLKGTSEFNYTFTDTGSLGIYYVNGICTAGSDTQNWRYSFAVNPSGGAENNTTFFIILSAISLILLLLAFIFKNYIFALLSGFAFLGTGVYGMIYGFGNITGLYTQIISGVILGLGAIITLTSGLELLQEVSGGDNAYNDYGGEDDF